jgi:hypothetical protein
VKRALVAALVLAAAGTARAERPDLRVDVEPAAYVLRGFSVHLRAAVPWQPRLVAGLGAYGFDMPQMLVDLAAGNRDEDWDVRLFLGTNVFADYFFGASPREGWLAGGQIGLQHFRAERDAQEEIVVTLVFMARVGYEWHPWETSGFYLFPWLGAAYTPEIDRTGDDLGYETPAVTPYGAVELGWRF